MNSVYSSVLCDMEKIRKKYKKIIKQNFVSEEDLDFFENFHLINRCVSGMKRDLKRCKKEIYKNERLFYKLCARASKQGFGEKDIFEILGKSADYSAVFVTELLTKCALIKLIAEGGEDASECIKNIRRLREFDFSVFFKICEEERMLEKIEGFCIGDGKTKMQYRERAFKNAQRLNMSCTEYLKSADGKTLFTEQRHGEITLAAEIIIPICLCIFLSVYTGNIFAGLLLILPVWQICSAVIVRASMYIFKTERLPRVKKDYLTEENSKTLIAVSVLLTDENSIKNMERHLKKLYFSNCSENISLCILADLKGSAAAENPEDDKILCGAKNAVEKLRAECKNTVCLVRGRVYSKTQNEFMGRERKRGAIEDLVFSLCGENMSFSHIFGGEIPENVKYILALDSDTDLTLDCAEELLQTALHPRNSKRYGIFTMRTETDTECSRSTTFSRLTAGDGGITAYHSSAAERYQDIFGRSIFSGKGLINVEKFRKRCTDKFTEETVLSHDILEGELVSSAYVSECQALDLFPTNQLSYLKRLHRWVRGDWQNSVFIFSPRPFKNKEKNSLSFLSRFKLFDNLRRSITPFSALLCILLSAFAGGKISAVLFAAAVLSVTVNDIISLFFTLFSLGRGGFSRRFYSGNIPHGIYPAIRAAVALIMLPAEALTGLDGAARGLYRRLVSRKNMLLWTTSQQGEAKGKLISEFLTLLPNIISSALLFISVYPRARFMALIFLLDIPFALLSGKRRMRKRSKIDGATKKQLISDAEKMWRFYADFANEENSFLPPDNVQTSPVYREAQRTSPTNIGLMLASSLAAYDMNIISKEEMLSFLENTLTTVEKMEKWHGNLYNWYDTVTSKPIEPFFISTVDSGNFLCSLTALKSGLLRVGGTRAEAAAGRIEKLLSETDLVPLYNEKNGLLHIGCDVRKNNKSDSYYDLLMSEARMTSYYAVATRQAPRKHWEMLGRQLARYKGYSGPVSWTGTAFEFFMPNIFLPSYKNTLEYEGLKFCQLCQKSYARENGIPFGISESCYYDFDVTMNYRYKANGVDQLGLKQNIPNELTVSPYSTYLVLPFDTKAALKNLRELRKLGVYGEYGFFEAVDFTEQRTMGQQKMTVKSFMAHHLGMSILSIDNALNGNIMQKRFMDDARQMTAESLLRERIPNRPFTVNEKRKKKRSVGLRVRFSPVKMTDNIEGQGSVAAVYTNGEYTALLCDSGASSSFFGGVTVQGITKNPAAGENGIYSAVCLNGKTHSFTRHADFGFGGKYSAALCEKRVKYFSDSDLGRGEKEVVVSADSQCEVHSFSFKADESGKGYGAVYFQPLLCLPAPYLSHKAFAKLFLLSSADRENGCIVFKYTFRDKEENIYCCVGSDSEGVVSLSRENVLKRGEENVFINFDSLSENFENIPDTCVALKIPITFKKGRVARFRLIISAGKSREEAMQAYKSGFGDIKGAKSVYSISGQSREMYFETVCAASLNMNISAEQISALKNVECKKEDIWKYGVSGDFPVFLFFADSGNIKEAENAVRISESLYKSGIKCDLIAVCREKNPYDRSVRKALASDSPAVHCVGAEELSKADENKLICFASRCNKFENKTATIAQVKITKAESKGYGEEGIFKVTPDTFLPWSWILANENFGTLLSNCSLGYTYFKNSQENKITPWINDTRAASGERLFFLSDGETVDIIDKSEMTLFRDSVVYSSCVKLNDFTHENTVKEIDFTTKITVKGNKKLIEVRPKGDFREAELAYLTAPVLGDRLRFPRFTDAVQSGDKITFKNTLTDGSESCYLYCENSSPFYSLEQMTGTAENVFAPSENPIIGIKRKVKPNESVTFILGADGEERDFRVKNKIAIETHDEALNKLYNDFLPVQIINGRILARTSFYQCSGAYGFRDQLQDILSVIHLAPELCRKVITRCAAAQFREGDVLHWFHTERGAYRGVRTRYSDDLLWLIWAVRKYCKITGDLDFLKTEVTFLDGDVLEDNEEERFSRYIPSSEKAALLEHCIRAFNKAYKLGAHSLILMGGGDWNDGFNKIGRNGRGESVFTSQLICVTGEMLAELTGDGDILQSVEKMRRALEESAFNKDRYIRCFLDSGELLGVPESKCCKIDSLTQSFAVFAGLDKERCKAALNTAYDELADEKYKVVRLFSPPFHKKDGNIGYITSYPSGIRENGGQYTHAAVWLARAFIMNGQSERGLKILKMLNPLTKNNAVYKTEPYFLTGDVYYHKGLKGRGGWSLYTGSAAWYYSTVTEDLLGIRIEGDRLYFAPQVKEVFPFTAKLLLNGAEITLSAESFGGKLYCDGKKADYIPLDNKNHSGKIKI